MLPLIPLAISLVPQLAQWLFGDDATAKRVNETVAQVAGSDNPVTARSAVQLDPEVSAQLTVALARIAAEKQAERDEAQHLGLLAQLSDTQNARAQTLALADRHSPLAWGAPIYSVCILACFGYAEWLSWHSQFPESAVQIGIVETLKMLAVAVGSYWVGSSAGSVRKSTALRAAQDQLANSVPVKT